MTEAKDCSHFSTMSFSINLHDWHWQLEINLTQNISMQIIFSFIFLYKTILSWKSWKWAFSKWTLSNIYSTLRQQLTTDQKFGLEWNFATLTFDHESKQTLKIVFLLNLFFIGSDNCFVEWSFCTATKSFTVTSNQRFDFYFFSIVTVVETNPFL